MHGKYRGRKHVLLPLAVKALTGKVEVITSLNRMSHSIAYTQLEEVGTVWALNKLEKVM